MASLANSCVPPHMFEGLSVSLKAHRLASLLRLSELPAGSIQRNRADVHGEQAQILRVHSSTKGFEAGRDLYRLFLLGRGRGCECSLRSTFRRCLASWTQLLS